jgi:formate dehydrogenase subunit gamma
MTLTDIIDRHREIQGPLLPILHDVQKAFGYISEDHMRGISTALNLTRAEVYGVVSFYHDFKLTHDARPVLKLCRAEACKARGVEAMLPNMEKAAGARVKIETIHCLGLCSVGPAAMTGTTVHARLNTETAVVLVMAQ